MAATPETDTVDTNPTETAAPATDEETHNSFVDVVRRELSALETRLDQMRVDAELARMDGREVVHAAERELFEQRDAVKRRIEQLAGSSTDAWRALRQGVDHALTELHTAIERVRSELTK